MEKIETGRQIETGPLTTFFSQPVWSLLIFSYTHLNFSLHSPNNAPKTGKVVAVKKIRLGNAKEVKRQK